MSAVIWFLAIHFSTILCVKSSNLPLYSRCRANQGIIKGICVHVEECKPVMDQLRAGSIRVNPLAVCSKIEKTICCPFSGTLRLQNVETSTKSAIKNHFYDDDIEIKHQEVVRDPLENTVKIIENKCIEYGKVAAKTCSKRFTSLVVGGKTASRDEFPHHALLGYGWDLRFLCGGSLISRNFILTAAHCSRINNNLPRVARFGAKRSYGRDFNITKIHKHPSYYKTSKSIIGDIALLELSSNIEINQHIYPICLPKKDQIYDKAVVTGFGRNEYGMFSNKLMKATLEEFGHDECQQLWNSTIIGKYSMKCFGHRTKEIDSCNGDSGGPIQVTNNDNVNCTYTLIGIVSFGKKECGTIGVPGVYVNVYHYLDWIAEIVWKHKL